LLVAHIRAERIRDDVQVVAHNNRQNAGQSTGVARVDAANPRVRNRATQNFGVGHPRQTEIAGVYRLARHLFHAVNAANIASDYGQHINFLEILTKLRKSFCRPDIMDAALDETGFHYEAHEGDEERIQED
jgi:hypothetical protein